MTNATTYDELPYAKLAFSQTHPNRLAAIARVFGATPVPPSKARILELGCAHGGNIVPMGIELPGAELLGIDLSRRQIEDGQATLTAAGITNVTLRQADLMDIDDSWGRFDYIISHGLYSWVPPEAQAKIMQICSRNLEPNGVAYVSYNCNPGWRIRGMVREMLLFHTVGVQSPTEKIRHARALLDYLASGTAQTKPYAALLQQEAAAIRNSDDAYLFHEHLEADNHPLYFHEFMAQAHAAGLMYLAESPIRSMFDTDLDAKTVATLNQLGSDNILHVEQYMDFLRNRTFRQTLLVHRGIKLVRDLDWRNLESTNVAIRLELTAKEHDVNTNEKVTYTEVPTGVEFSVSQPIVKAATQILRNNAPQGLPFSQLVDQARSALTVNEPQAQDVIGAYVFSLLSIGIADLTIEPWRCAASVSDHPVASPLARYQAQQQQDTISLHHQMTSLKSPSVLWHLLQLLDGRSKDDILAALTAQADAGNFQLQSDGQPIADPARMREVLQANLPRQLELLRKLALLLKA